MIFRQLFESTSCTYSYLIACSATRHAVLIDPVYDTIKRDLSLIVDLGLTLVSTLDTHIHADHLTGAQKAKSLVNSQIAAPGLDGLGCVDIHVAEGQGMKIGELTFWPMYTPGHTDTHHAYVLEKGGCTRVFTGDSLLIDGCGRTDFQNGDARKMFHSIREKLFMLPDETLVYPAHDYNGRFVSTIAQEKTRNPRIGLDKSEAEFLHIMENLNLPYPSRMDVAVPGNRLCGLCPPTVPPELRKFCDAHDQG